MQKKKKKECIDYEAQDTMELQYIKLFGEYEKESWCRGFLLAMRYYA